MAKKDKDEVKAVKAVKAEDGATLAERAPAWVEPFPASVLKEAKVGDKVAMVESVFVRVVPTQDLIINGQKLPAGHEVVVGADFAHAHAAVLSAPLDADLSEE